MEIEMKKRAVSEAQSVFATRNDRTSKNDSYRHYTCFKSLAQFGRVRAFRKTKYPVHAEQGTNRENLALSAARNPGYRGRFDPGEPQAIDR